MSSRGPGKIAHSVRHKVPGKGTSGCPGSRRWVPDLPLAANDDRGIAAPRPRQAPALLGSQHVDRILKHSRSSDDHIGGHREAHVEVSVLQVELTLAVVLLGIPAAYVVVNCKPRIPLSRLVNYASVDLLNS